MAEIWRWGRKPENPHFLKSDELWSTYCDTFGKPSGRATWHQNFVDLSSKTAEIWRWGQKPENPHFWKNSDFRSKNTSDLREKHLYRKRLFSRKKNLKGGGDAPPPKFFFLKIRFFERPLEKTHFRKKKLGGVGPSLEPQIWGPPNFFTFRRHLNIVWKFRRDRQPQWRRYGDGFENRKTSTFLKLMNFGPHILTHLESPRAGLHDTKILWI